MSIVYRTAHYDKDGLLLDSRLGFPVETVPDPQKVADLMAAAAEAGSTYQAGTYLVWVDPDVEPAEHIEQADPPDGGRSYGPGHPPVPRYRWEIQSDLDVRLVQD